MRRRGITATPHDDQADAQIRRRQQGFDAIGRVSDINVAVVVVVAVGVCFVGTLAHSLMIDVRDDVTYTHAADRCATRHDFINDQATAAQPQAQPPQRLRVRPCQHNRLNARCYALIAGRFAYFVGITIAAAVHLRQCILFRRRKGGRCWRVVDRHRAARVDV